MTEFIAPYSDWRSRQFRCACGWSGAGADAATELFSELLEINCPKCDGRLGLASFPTFDEVRAAAAQGNPDALRELATVEEAERRREEFERTCLVAPAQLPDVDGDTDHFSANADDVAILHADGPNHDEPVGLGFHVVVYARVAQAQLPGSNRIRLTDFVLGHESPSPTSRPSPPPPRFPPPRTRPSRASTPRASARRSASARCRVPSR